MIFQDGAYIPAEQVTAVRTYAGTYTETIARAARRLSYVRDACLNLRSGPYVQASDEGPFGMERSPYPDRVVARPGFEAELAKRTLTSHYNQRPAWLAQTRVALDVAMAAVYGWADWTLAMPDEEILRRLLAIELERSARSTSAGRRG